MFRLETIDLKSLKSGFQPVLKSGGFVTFTVGKLIEPGVYSILINTRSVSVRSSVPLAEGTLYRARVGWSGNRLQLNITKSDKDLLDSYFERYSVIPNKNSRIIAEGLIRSGIPLVPDYFSKLGRVLKGSKDSDTRLARILILLMDKGIPLTEQNISEIMMVLGQDEGSGSGEREKQKQKYEKFINKDEIKKDLIKKINRIDFGNDLLKYFNHRIAGHDNWLIIPMDFSFLRRGQGVLKLRLDDKFSVTNIVLTLDDGNEWEFNIIMGGKYRTISVSSSLNDSWEKSPAFKELKEKLYKKDIFFDDINREPNRTDGFTLPPEKALGVDFTV